MAPAAQGLAPGARFQDRYEIQELLGAGSHSRVYRATQLSTGQAVAIKLLHERDGGTSTSGSEAERFRRETRICAALSHTNIVPLLDSGETEGGQLYAVFGYVPGETLEQALAREGRLPVREALRLLTQVLDALAAAHAQGIVHRDIKPTNLMLSGTGARRNALVLDFGMGGLVENRRRAEWQTLTQAHQFLGTPLYAAPEQLAGEPPTERSDLYAWGLVLLQCLTGHPPFEAEGAAARLMRGGGEVEIPEWLREHRLGKLLAAVTARDPAKRDVSLEALIEALDEIAGGELPEAPDEAHTPAPLTGTGERRHLTVMFCDLAGSTALSQQLDAETWREIVRAYQARGAEAVERYDGHVVQYLGDGLLVYFGYPNAHEDDAERAIRAGREVLHSLELLSAQTQARHGVAVQGRVGIHTGPVVVGEMGGGEKREVLALGDTPNIAARLEGFAEPGAVLVSDATLRLVPGIFVTKDRGTPALKDIQEPIRVHEILLPSGIRSRLERASGLSPFVGRKDELALLVHGFEDAGEGRGQAVLIAGEAGIGKSRLVRELRERLREQPHSWLECQASPYTQGSALHPLVALLEAGLDFREGDPAEEKLDRLERGLAHVGLEPNEAVPLVAGLLSLRLPARYPPLEISPQLQRQKTLETLLAWLLALAEKQPVVLCVEDLHWIDPSTLEWLGMLIAQCPTASVLLLMTHRPEFTSGWPAREHLRSVTLGRLSRRESQDLVTRAIRERELPAELVEHIAHRSDGVPLFVEELAKGVVEAKHTDAQDIPETLQDLLMARLDRLGEAKTVAQLAAVIGREFEYALLEAVAPLKEAALREGLARLTQAELVYQRGIAPRATYTFKHALVQDTAYASLLDAQRREVHGRIADALEQRFPERLARDPELVARHSEAAGRTEQAVGHYRSAASRAAQRCAHAEAIGHLNQAIALLGTLEPTPERRDLDLQLQIALGASHFSVRGGGDPGAERAYARARELCADASESPELVRALVGLSLFHFSRGRVLLARELAERALAHAERIGDVYPRLVAHARLGITLLYLSDPRSTEHLEAASALYDPAAHRPLAAAWGQDWGIVARDFAALAIWGRGYFERARRHMEETLALAREGDPYSLSFALVVASALHALLDEREEALERAEEAMAIARERGFPTVLMTAHSSRGWAVGGEEGIAEIREALRWGLAAGFPVLADSYARLARVQLEMGRLDDALATADAGLEYLDACEANLGLCQLHETRGDILLQRGAAGEAERSYRAALEFVREKGSHQKAWELRAATPLARLLRDGGRRDEARTLLAPVYAWFTEGFDTAHLKNAKALLDELV